MPWIPTTDQILDLDGVHWRADGWRWDLEDRVGNVIGELLPNAERPPTITNNTDSGIPRSVSSFNLPAAQVSDINPVSDRVRAWAVLQNDDAFEMGVFLWGNEDEPERPWGVESASSMVDKMHILDQATRTSIGQNKGANIIVAAVGLAVYGNGLTFEEIDYETTGIGLSAPWAHPPNSNRAGLVRELMSKIGYLPPHVNRSGRLQYRDAPDLATAPPDHILEVGPTSTIIANSTTRSNDLLEAANEFTVFESSGQGAPIVGTYTLPSSAPHSIPKRGFPVPDVQSQQGLGSAAQAVKAARTNAMTSARATYRWKKLATTFDPRFDTFGVVQHDGQNWLSVAWSTVCRSGAPMQHTLRAVY